MPTARACRSAQGGYLVLKRPWPAMLRGIYGDPERYRATYWSRFPGMYFAGDGAKRDVDGYFWLLGRVDDVMNVAGHRISTIEVESALVDHPSVAEAAVVGKNDPVSGQAIFAFVTVRAGHRDERRARARAARARGEGHRAHRAAEVPAVHAGPAQDPLGQDHAPAAARRRRGPRAGRHDHARRRRRGRDHPRRAPARPKRTDGGGDGHAARAAGDGRVRAGRARPRWDASADSPLRRRRRSSSCSVSRARSATPSSAAPTTRACS